MHGVLNWKKCKRCGKRFDIGTNYDICPECRRRYAHLVIEKDKQRRLFDE